jgi:hypothetical protein
VNTNTAENVNRELLVAPQSIEMVLAIAYYGRSGSLFLQSLLDSHPNVITLPGDLMNNYAAFWNKFRHLPASAFIEKFIETHPELFGIAPPDSYLALNGFTTLGSNKDQASGVDQNIFSNALKSAMGKSVSPVPRKLFFQSVYVAYATALGQQLDTSRPPIIVHGIHGAIDARINPLVEDFPETRFITMVREPVRSVNSHVFKYARSNHPKGCCVANMDLLFGVLIGGMVLGPSSDQSRAIRLEDLHGDKHNVLEKLCKWIGIPWHDNLMKSTFDGKQWWNDKWSQEHGKGTMNLKLVSTGELNLISPFDHYRIMGTLVNKHVKWGYPVPRWLRSVLARIILLPLLLIPFRIELLQYKEAESSLRNIIAGYISSRRKCAIGWVYSFTKDKVTLDLL